MSDFKPGTVIADTEGVLYFVIEVTANTRSAWKGGQCAVSADGNGHYLADLVLPHEVIVIDRHDDQAIDRLASTTIDAAGGELDGVTLTTAWHIMSESLRAFCRPIKPRLSEPDATGSIVTASCVHTCDRMRWIKGFDGNWWPEARLTYTRESNNHNDALPDDWDSLTDPEVTQ